MLKIAVSSFVLLYGVIGIFSHVPEIFWPSLIEGAEVIASTLEPIQDRHTGEKFLSSQLMLPAWYQNSARLIAIISLFFSVSLTLSGIALLKKRENSHNYSAKMIFFTLVWSAFLTCIYFSSSSLIINTLAFWQFIEVIALLLLLSLLSYANLTKQDIALLNEQFRYPVIVRGFFLGLCWMSLFWAVFSFKFLAWWLALLFFLGVCLRPILIRSGLFQLSSSFSYALSERENIRLQKQYRKHNSHKVAKQERVLAEMRQKLEPKEPKI